MFLSIPCFYFIVLFSRRRRLNPGYWAEKESGAQEYITISDDRKSLHVHPPQDYGEAAGEFADKRLRGGVHGAFEMDEVIEGSCGQQETWERSGVKELRE